VQAPRILAKRTQRTTTVFGYRSRLSARFGASAGTTNLSSERSTNLRLWETTAGSASLFPACSLQGTPQLQRVER